MTTRPSRATWPGSPAAADSSDEPTTFNVRDVYIDALVRLQGCELFFGGEPSVAISGISPRSLPTEGSIRSSVQSCPWKKITEAIDRLRNREVAGKIALTLGA